MIDLAKCLHTLDGGTSGRCCAAVHSSSFVFCDRANSLSAMWLYCTSLTTTGGSDKSVCSRTGHCAPPMLLSSIQTIFLVKVVYMTWIQICCQQTMTALLKQSIHESILYSCVPCLRWLWAGVCLAIWLSNLSTNPTSSVSTDPPWGWDDENMVVLAKLMDLCQANLIH